MAERLTKRQHAILVQLRDEGETKLEDLASWNPARPGDSRRSAEALEAKGWIEGGSKVTATGAMVASDVGGDTIKLTAAGRAIADGLS